MITRSKSTCQRFLIFIAVFSFLCLSFACTDKKKTDSTKRQNETVNQMLSMMSKPDQEMVALLSLKYSKDPELIEKIIDLYLSETDFWYKTFKSSRESKQKKPSTTQGEAKHEGAEEKDVDLLWRTRDKSAYFNMVAKLSQESSLEPSIVASILFDYQTWKAARTAAESHGSSD